jgi:hypothetical protein
MACWMIGRMAVEESHACGYELPEARRELLSANANES